MRNSKPLLAAFAIVATFGCAEPALAFSDPVSPVTITNFTVFGEAVHLSGTAGGGFDFPGPTIGTFSLNLLFPDSSTVSGQLAFCDDLFNDIDPNDENFPYWFTDPNNPTGANDYLSPIGQTAIDNIVGLLYAANFDPQISSDPTTAAAYQLAIWQLEYGGPPNVAADPASDPLLQTLADSLAADASTDFANFTNDGQFGYVQLESPCDPALAGTITLNPSPFATPSGSEDPNCQTQGLITLVPVNHTRDVPEPGTLVLLGSGLIGFGAYRRRRRATVRIPT